MKRFNIFLVLLILLACIIPVQAAPPTQYKEVTTAGTDLKGKVFVNSDATGFTCNIDDGIITMSGHGTKEVKLKWIALKSSVKGVSSVVKVQHRNDAGVIDSTTTYDFDSMQDSQGFVYFTAEFSEVIIGGYVGSWSVSGYNLTTKDTLNLGQEYNGSDVRYVNASVTDNSVKSNPYDINTTGLVGWWKLDDDYLDSSGNGNNGTPYGSNISFVNGKYNNGSNFDGVKDYVDVGNGSSLNMNNSSFTFVSDIYLNPSSSINRIIKIESQATYGVSGDNKLGGYTYRSGAWNGSWTESGFILSDNTWYRVVMTSDGIHRSYYVDGVNVANIDSSGNPNGTYSGVRIGMYDTFPMNGLIDDVRIYNRALSTTEIQNNYYDHLQQLQINTTANSTYSTEWNSTANNPLSVPFGASELFTGLKFKVPATVVQDGITIYDYHNSTRFDITADIGVENDITKISETAANGLYSLNATHTPTNNGSGYINYTTTNTVLLNADFTNSATLSTNNANATMTASGANFNISTGYVVEGVEYYYIVNQYYFYAPTNLATASTTSTINVSWDATPNVDKYSIYQKDECVVWTNDVITIDGIGDESAWDTTNRFIIDTPNPVVYTDYDTIRGIYNENYFYVLVEAHDADVNTIDDKSILYGDFLNDGLTTDDRAWQVKENGGISRLKWSGTAWIAAPGSAATAVSTGAGTNNIVIEFAIPVSELGANFTNGSIFPMLWERECTSINPDVYSYHPFENVNNTDVSLWAQVQICNDSESKTFIANTTDLYYNVTGLDFFEWYRFGVSAWNGTQETSTAEVDGITLDVPRWSISGYILDGDGGPIEGAQVWAAHPFISARETSNATGYYQHYFRDDDYVFYANKTGYTQNAGLDVTVVGANLTNQNITLQELGIAEVYQLLLDIQEGQAVNETVPDTTQPQNSMPLPLFIVWTLILIGLVYVAYPKRDDEEDLEIGIKNITASFIALILAFTLAKISINGQLIQTYSGISAINTVVTDVVIIQIGWLGWLFTFIGITMVILTIYLLVSVYNYRYGDDEDE